MKSLADQCKTFFTFPPGHYYTQKQVLLSITSLSMKIMKRDQNLDLELIRSTLIEATRKRLMSDVPIVCCCQEDGFFINSAIAARLLASREKLHSFSIGLDADAPDAVAARKVADFLAEHHEIYFQ
jgi:asparagine synthase (glutamine-hydrolysing)